MGEEVQKNSNRVCLLTNEEIASNIQRIRANIDDALKASGRSGEQVTLLGACKTMDKEVTDFIIENGLLDALGDNKVQELLDKWVDSDIPWHFIGNLQTNKVKYIIDKVSLVHSLDRLSLAKEIDKQARKHDKIMNCLIEVNLGHEESKGGIYVEDIDAFVEGLKEYPNVKIVGLMSVMPNIQEKDKLEPYYKKFNDLFDRLRPIFGDDFKIKSIGMSGDYETAIKYGANLIRIGRLIFGDRRYV